MVEITESAKLKIIDLLLEENNPKLALRTFVQGGGCSGFSYGFTFDQEKNEDDFEFPINEQYNVLVDAMSMQYLQGAKIDYKEELMGSQFEFIFEKRSSTLEDQHPNERPRGPETKPTMPAGTVRVDVTDVYDWYKLGQHISDLEGLGKHDFGKGPPSTIIAFGSEAEEHKYLKNLKKLGLVTTDLDPIDPKQPKGMKRQKTDPTYNVGK